MVLCSQVGIAQYQRLLFLVESDRDKMRAQPSLSVSSYLRITLSDIFQPNV